MTSKVPSRAEMMHKIREYWTTIDGEPELGEFTDYVLGIITRQAEHLAEVRVQEELEKLIDCPQTVKFSEDGKPYVVQVVFVDHIKAEIAHLKAEASNKETKEAPTNE